ncbi:MAG: helix-turn-helix transcriptional regulator [Opitutaceae bacterium]|nr:helix-turn-helix transcriptional regulator [Opitutaceae bacterium]
MREPTPLVSERTVSGRYFFHEIEPSTSGVIRPAFGGREVCDFRYEERRTTFPFYALEYVASGEGEVTLNGVGPVRLRPGMTFAHGPGIALHMKAHTPMIKYFLCLNGRGVRTALTQRLGLLATTRVRASHGDLQELFELLLREAVDASPQAATISRYLLEILLTKLEPGKMEGAHGTALRDRFLACKAFIDSEGRSCTDLKALAQATGNSIPSLHRLFRQHTGITPYRYLTQHKMNWAARELLKTDELVKQVAERVGFEDPLHFSRAFKRCLGLSPAAYRALHGATPWSSDHQA